MVEQPRCVCGECFDRLRVPLQLLLERRQLPERGVQTRHARLDVLLLQNRHRIGVACSTRLRRLDRSQHMLANTLERANDGVGRLAHGVGRNVLDRGFGAAENLIRGLNGSVRRLQAADAGLMLGVVDAPGATLDACVLGAHLDSPRTALDRATYPGEAHGAGQAGRERLRAALGSGPSRGQAVVAAGTQAAARADLVGAFAGRAGRLDERLLAGPLLPDAADRDPLLAEDPGDPRQHARAIDDREQEVELPLTCLPASSPREGRGEERTAAASTPPLSPFFTGRG